MFDEKGQMHVLEVMIAALLFLAALRTAIEVSTPSSDKQSLNFLKTMGDDSLLVLDNKPSNDSQYYNSTLVKYIFSNDIKNLTSFLNKTLPIYVSYSISLFENGKNYEIISMGKVTGESIVSNYMIYYSGQIYEIQLLMWYEPRG